VRLLQEAYATFQNVLVDGGGSLGTWDLAPDLELSDECTVHPQPIRFENFFFVHEIVQLVLGLKHLGSSHMVCSASSERDERKEVESRVGETWCRLAALELQLGTRRDGLSLAIACTKSCRNAASCRREPTLRSIHSI
jgi:hypothetical protein